MEPRLSETEQLQAMARGYSLNGAPIWASSASTTRASPPPEAPSKSHTSWQTFHLAFHVPPVDEAPIEASWLIEAAAAAEAAATAATVEVAVAAGVVGAAGALAAVGAGLAGGCAVAR